LTYSLQPPVTKGADSATLRAAPLRAIAAGGRRYSDDDAIERFCGAFAVANRDNRPVV